MMAEAAIAFLNSLAPEQRARAMRPFDDQERFNWFYTPVPRQGLPLKEMSATQRALAFALLGSGLSRRGYIKALGIISLEEVLHVLEEGKGPVRDPDLYFFTIFGEPSESGTWGYRVEGHHVSQNYTILKGTVIDAPSFFGANPAEIREGPRKLLQVLAWEQELARRLMQSLDSGQRAAAVIQEAAYPDIITSNSRQAALAGEPSGIALEEMNPDQRDALARLLDEYVLNVPQELAKSRRRQVDQAGERLYFAWAGGIEPGEPHYYRIQAPAFLVEYDNTQNGANHIHSVWRDFEGDFGRDLLREHYGASHSAQL